MIPRACDAKLTPQCPIQTSLIEQSLLSPAERNWINSYHAEVQGKVELELRQYGDERALAWLRRECVPI